MATMTLLTLNTHSLMGEDADERRERFVSALLRERPDVVALQEVNQRADAPALTEPPLRFTPCGGGVPLREGLYVHAVAEALARGGLAYAWTWLPVKRGYGCYDEGLAFLSRTPILQTRALPVSRPRPYGDWRRRMALLIRVEGLDGWLCNLHTSWWGDAEEPFAEQWERLTAAWGEETPRWLLGDLNNPAELRGEGYDLIAAHGFFDCHALAERRRGGSTVAADADGWRGRLPAGAEARIDQIWCRRPCAVPSYRTVFDGRDHDRISDHCGVMVTVEKGEE